MLVAPFKYEERIDFLTARYYKWFDPVDLQWPVPAFLKKFEKPDDGFGNILSEIPAAKALFYFFDFPPKYFHQMPILDLNLLLANTAYFLIQKHKAMRIELLDYWTVAPAILLAGSLPPDSVISLPPAPDGKDELAKKFAGILLSFFPDILFGHSISIPDQYPVDSIMLGQDPFTYCEKDPGFLRRLKNIGGGAFLTSWNCLGAQKYAHTRGLLVKNNNLNGILQLPVPKRAGAVRNPALVVLGAAGQSGRIKAGNLSDENIGAGRLDMDMSMQMIFDDRPDDERILEIPAEQIAGNGLYSLMPAYIQAERLKDAENLTTTLSKYAQVLRCQTRRERMTGTETVDEDLTCRKENNMFVVREVSLDDCDELTGFLDPVKGNRVKAPVTPLVGNGKYILQAHDILFAFRGSPPSIGKAGFVQNAGLPAITGLSICIIRPYASADPVWLYYYLRRKSVRNQIFSLSCGATLLTINTDTLKSLPMPEPDQDEIIKINAMHARIAENMNTISVLQSDIRKTLEEINTLEKKHK